MIDFADIASKFTALSGRPACWTWWKHQRLECTGDKHLRNTGKIANAVPLQSSSLSSTTTSLIKTGSSWLLSTLVPEAVLLQQTNTNAMQRDNSMLTFESASVAGSAGIVEKLSVRLQPPYSDAAC